MKKIVFVTTAKGRAPHVALTLPKNLQDNQDYENAKFVLLDYGSTDGLLDYIVENHMDSIRSGRLAVYSFADWGPFRMAHAKNMAHRLGILEGAEILVNMDADNYTGAGFAHYIDRVFKRRGDDTFLWGNINAFTHEEGRPRGISGRIAVTTEAFLKSGGYDEAKYNEWGPDDKDFNRRLMRLGYNPIEIEKPYLKCVLHNDKKRFREYPHLRPVAGGEDSIPLPSERMTSVANFGKAGLGVVIKFFPDIYGGPTLPVRISPLPTRIYGCGMHKTGTTSLHTALKILGIDSAHWQGAHWAKAIWREMNNDGWSETLERHYALCDLPITLLYKQLDKAYPGSKFILTTRSEEKWLESVRRHWSPQYNKFREGWDNDPFTNRIHQVLYGQTNFDADIFLARYRRHNAEVLEYFKSRPNDLLILDMDATAVPWLELCGFMNKPIPNVPYPQAFKTGD